MPNGWIGEFRFYTSEDGATWVEKVHDTFSNTPDEQDRTFAASVASFARLEALDEVNGLAVTSVAELTVLGE